VINHDRDARVLFDIAYPLELARGRALGLFVDRRVKILSVEGKTNWDDVRVTGGIRRGEMGDPGGAKQAQGARGQFQSFQTSPLLGNAYRAGYENRIAGCSKRFRGEAREKSTSGGVLSRTL
jgi:hypothetical protein